MNAMTTPSRILRLPAIALVVVLAFSFTGRAMAQTDARVIPPPPRLYDEDRPSGDRGHQAEQDMTDPEKAFDSKTGQNLFWDCVKNTWVDAKTGKALGFMGGRDKDGAVVPPPPRLYDEDRPSGDRGHQAEQDMTDPEKAFDSKTGQNLFWDRKDKTWKDGKTGKSLGFQGARTKKPCPPPTAPKTNDVVKTASAPARFDVGLGYAYMHPDAEVVKDLNGFTVAGFYNVNSWLAFGGEFSGLYGTETQNFDDGSVKTSLDRYLYLFGPQVTVHPCDRTRVYGRVLVGGAHDENKISFLGDTWGSSADAFALAVGAGVDVQVTRHFSVGPSFDYVPTHFISPNGNNWQNNWRVGLAGKFSF
jgi:opacity protein-like surface antigen